MIFAARIFLLRENDARRIFARKINLKAVDEHNDHQRRHIIALIQNMPDDFLPALEALIKNFETTKAQAEYEASLKMRVSKILQKVPDREVPEWDKIE